MLEWNHNDFKRTVITENKRKYVINWFMDKLEEISKNKNHRTPWYRTGRRGPTGIGYTLESAFGKPEDNLQQPDLAPKGLKKCIELKAHDMLVNAPITLFTKSPGSPKRANDVIRQNYGYTTPTSNGLNICHTSVYEHGDYNTKSGNYFKIINDRDNEEVVLAIGNKGNEHRVATWSYDRLNKAISSKIKVLAIVKAEDNGKHGKDRCYRYLPHADILTRFTLLDFLRALDNNDAFIDLRIGAYMSGKNKGKTHDHGTGFRMTLPDVMKYGALSGHVITK